LSIGAKVRIHRNETFNGRVRHIGRSVGIGTPAAEVEKLVGWVVTEAVFTTQSATRDLVGKMYCKRCSGFIRAKKRR
jgi:hypothetical protein